MKKSVIKGFGYYVPEKVVTNDDLAKLMSTNDEWITERTGIKQRHYRKNINDAEETTAYLGLQASKAIESAGLTAKDIDYIVFATFLRIIIFRDVEFCYRICWDAIQLAH
jgi:3-oxoacyl-[acyl-carrier-protein] synthase-3